MEKRLKGTALVMFVIVLINCVAVSAITGSMGNARMVLYPEVNGWFTTTIEKTILVKNVNEVAINISLVPDEPGEEFLEVIDKEFVLQPGEEKKAEFLVKVKKEGNYEGKINVFFASLEKNEPGVVLSSTIIVIAKKAQDYDESEEEDENLEGITGDIINDENKENISPMILISFGSTLILIIILIWLFIISGKKASLKISKRKRKSDRGEL